MMNKRIPTMKNALTMLLEKGVPVDVVLDVGILTGTQPLIETFKNIPHHLFEPVELHFPKIRKNYKNIDHTIHHVALSDEEGIAYLPCWAIHNDGVITHSEVSETFVTSKEMPNLVTCNSVRKTSLDNIFKGLPSCKNALLKLDVDGHELSILNGAIKTLETVSVVVIEAPLNKVVSSHFFERSEFLRSQGFYLVDIVDFCYYDGVLWQVDLIFVKCEIIESIESLRPFESENFQFESSKWNPLSDPTYKERYGN